MSMDGKHTDPAGHLQQEAGDMGVYMSGVEILNNMGCGICVCSTEEKLLFANEKFCGFFGGRLDGKTVKLLLAQALDKEQQESSGELYIEEDDRWFDVHRREIRWVDQKLVDLYTVYDITETKRYQQKIEKQANNDFLTGLYNRMRCEKDLEAQISLTRENGGEGALM